MTSMQDVVKRIKGINVKEPQQVDESKEIITFVKNPRGEGFFVVSNLNPIPSDNDPKEAFDKYNERQSELDRIRCEGKTALPTGWRFKPKNQAFKKLIRDVRDKNVKLNLKPANVSVNRQIPLCLQTPPPEIKKQNEDWEPEEFIVDFPFSYGKEEKEEVCENFNMIQKPTFDSNAIIKQAKSEGAKSSQLSLLAREAKQVEKKLLKDYEDKISENLEVFSDPEKSSEKDSESDE
jgi:hypothetical protein